MKKSNPRRESHARRLEKLATVAVNVGLRPAPGQQVILSAPLEALPLVRAITRQAYEAGASMVTTLFEDSQSSLLRYRFARDGSFEVATNWLFDGMGQAFAEGAARMAISSEIPGLLAGEDPVKVGAAAAARGKAYKPALEFVTASKINWSICAAANPAWAKKVFPDLPPRQALAKLWEAIFKASRADVYDPISAWDAHNRVLAARKTWLNGKNYSALRFRGPGTDLTVGLADGHAWLGGEKMAKNGVTFNANVPTEEVFTTPHAMRVDGYVSSTKPLSLQGNVVEGIVVKFAGGRIVEAKAERGDAALQNLIKTDDGSMRLGEVALVPHSSPISQSGILFYNTLFDENAACHIAIGQSYSTCFHNRDMSKDELVAAGANYSNTHVDWMIGSGQIDVDGITIDGAVEPVMRQGEWAISL